MSDQTLKERCRAVMEAHLVSKGYPNLSRRELVEECPAMWRALDLAGLMPELKAEGYTFEGFCGAALKKAQESAIFEHLFSTVRRMG